jgi:hypothetical protein
VNLCPKSISTKVHDIHQMHSTIKHEILHALVCKYVRNIYRKTQNTTVCHLQYKFIMYVGTGPTIWCKLPTLLNKYGKIKFFPTFQGFSAGLYAFYRDPQGEPLTPRLESTGKPVFNQTYVTMTTRRMVTIGNKLCVKLV